MEENPNIVTQVTRNIHGQWIQPDTKAQLPPDTTLIMNLKYKQPNFKIRESIQCLSGWEVRGKWQNVDESVQISDE